MKWWLTKEVSHLRKSTQYFSSAARNITTLNRYVSRCNRIQRMETCNIHTSNLVPQIDITPSGHLLVDDKLCIKVNSLKAYQKVTLLAMLDEEGKKFESYGWFKADENGVVNVSQHASLAGSYIGVSPMGLFWSMVPSPEQEKGIRLIKKNIDTPLQTVVNVYDGHLSLDEIRNATEICVTVIKRWYKGPGVRSIEVAVGRIRGKLFLPPEPGPFPGVIDLFGTVGGLVEFRSALLASRGFATLSLPYFLYKDLPKDLFSIDLDYFLEAIDWLVSHESVCRGGCGVIGTSKGGDIALMMGAYCPKIRAIVNINGCPFASTFPMKYSGGNIPAVQMNSEKMELLDGKYVMKNTFDYGVKDFTPVWNNNAKVLNILCEDDQASPTESLRLLQKHYPREKADNCMIAAYPDAGHLLEMPYSPLCRWSYHKTFDMKFWWGGHPEGHAFAQEDAWRRTLQLFKEQLPMSSVVSRL